VNKEKLDITFKNSPYKKNSLAKWFILRPPQRKEKVKLHPAKYPEVLIKYLIESYSQPGDNIYDPMSGTGSTQVAAIESGRNAYGCEITEHFYNIALERLNDIELNGRQFALVNDDAYHFDNHHELDQTFNYIVTSPPYWDMLNMKGAETQKKRQEKGLHVNYSELDTDLGNCSDYDEFLTKLIKIYTKTIVYLENGGYFTIIVKNIKKKGTIYTFAWDLVEHLGKNYEFVNAQFWLQDDIKIAPYGWGNAWVSNTFHHYVLTFRKAE
jgi:DNA modification methylase